MPREIKYLVCCLFLLTAYSSRASHSVGSEFSYQFVDSLGGTYHYRFTLTTYADPVHGQPEAIAQDNPAFFAIYRGEILFSIDTGSYYTSSAVLTGISICACGYGTVPITLVKKTFVADYHLPASTSGYTIVYQRCCRNSALSNITTPGDIGVTYSCTIPPSGTARYNNSAVFANRAPDEICINTPFTFDCSATDADGDSLSYELCTAYLGASDADIKPIPAPPPFTPVPYISSLSYSNPMYCSAALAIDPVTGILSGTPNIAGRYLIAVCCNEWRHGLLINNVRREFEFAIAADSGTTFHPFAGNDTTIMVGDSLQFNATGGTTYLWTPGTFLSDTTTSNPAGYFPIAGTYTYVLQATSDSGCTGTDTVNVNVIAYSYMAVPNGFTPNGDGSNDYLKPIAVKGSTLKSFKVFNSFGKMMYEGAGGWDGTYNGTKQGTGVYLWELEYQDNNGRPHQKKGNVTLLR
jgi:gliding motility-associated-like protein